MYWFQSSKRAFVVKSFGGRQFGGPWLTVRHSWVGSMGTGIFMLSLRTGFFHLCCPTRPQGVHSCGCSWLDDHLNSVVASCYWHVICHCVQEGFYSFLFPPCRLLCEARARWQGQAAYDLEPILIQGGMLLHFDQIQCFRVMVWPCVKHERSSFGNCDRF